MGVQLFPGGPNAKFYRNPYNVIFWGGGGGKLTIGDYSLEKFSPDNHLEDSILKIQYLTLHAR